MNRRRRLVTAGLIALALGALAGQFACARSDPNGTCYAVSRRAAKRDIGYLSAPEVKELADKALGVRLAHFRYESEPSERDPHLGFILEDVGRIEGVDWPNGSVDLYGYTSLVLAATQAQGQDLVQLQSRVGKLERLIVASVLVQEQKMAQLSTRIRELELEHDESAERLASSASRVLHVRKSGPVPLRASPHRERVGQSPLTARRSLVIDTPSY